ncbi:MAG: M23 family peptidase, partial [Muribaculaceae bacterium]|nr:M23 family peptidase [Muribaculaceae bacterium]
MSRKVYYRFNTVTETYERVYPTRRERILAALKQAFEGISIGGFILLLLYYWIDLPREKRLREENTQLNEQLNDLNRRLDASIAVMEAIADRDNNFYRVIMQAEPISDSRRYAGLENSSAYRRLNSLDDAGLASEISDKMDMLDRQLYSQILSFDSLRVIASEQQERLTHIPSIMPVAESSLRKMASGYGYRVDPIYGTGKFHEGMDFSSPVGAPVYATG